MGCGPSKHAEMGSSPAIYPYSGKSNTRSSVVNPSTMWWPSNNLTDSVRVILNQDDIIMQRFSY